MHERDAKIEALESELRQLKGILLFHFGRTEVIDASLLLGQVPASTGDPVQDWLNQLE